MAGKDIYLGKMMESLETKLLTIDAMITELEAINLGVSQGITRLNIKAGTINSVNITHSAKTVAAPIGTAAPTSAKINLFNIYAIAKGSCKLTFNGRLDSARTVYFFYSIDNGVNWNWLATESGTTANRDYIFDIPVNEGNTMVALSVISSLASFTLNANTVNIKYDEANIGSGDAFSIS